MDINDGGYHNDLSKINKRDQITAVIVAPGCTSSVYEWENYGGKQYNCVNLGGSEALTCTMESGNSYHCSCNVEYCESDFKDRGTICLNECANGRCTGTNKYT